MLRLRFNRQIIYLNVHPLEVVSHWFDKMKVNDFEILLIVSWKG